MNLKKTIKENLVEGNNKRLETLIKWCKKQALSFLIVFIISIIIIKSQNIYYIFYGFIN